MAFRMTKGEAGEVARVKALIAETTTRLEESIAKLEEARVPVLAELTTLNAQREELAALLEPIVERAQGEWDDKSERWQEGDAAQAATDWIEKLTEIKEELGTEVEMELSLERDFEMPEIEPDLEDLPEEAE